MGSPLAPTFVDFFFSEFENKIMKELESKGVKTLIRYVSLI